MDREFLDGKPVLCDAAIRASEYLSGVLKENEKIVVMLSNGKKYMGQVIRFNHRMQDDYAIGKLEIVRYPPKN